MACAIKSGRNGCGVWLRNDMQPTLPLGKDGVVVYTGRVGGSCMEAPEMDDTS